MGTQVMPIRALEGSYIPQPRACAAPEQQVTTPGHTWMCLGRDTRSACRAGAAGLAWSQSQARGQQSHVWPAQRWWPLPCQGSPGRVSVREGWRGTYPWEG